MVRRVARALALALAIISMPSSAGQAFQDGDFVSWSFDSRWVGGPGGGQAIIVREVSGGNPGVRLRVDVAFTGPSPTLVATALKRDYVATQVLHGAAFSLSIDVLAGFGSEHSISLLVEQYGVLYMSGPLGATGVPGTFTTVSFPGTLQAAMFTRISDTGPTQPDFSGNVPTRFGFTSAGFGAHFYDNLRLELSVSPAPCAGFVDVADTDVFCGAVGWIRNRSITLGCTDDQYCPEANVTRAQMALFMSRLGAAIAPIVLYSEFEYPTLIVASGAPGTAICPVAPHTVGDAPRIARPSGTLSATATSSPSELQAYWMHSIDQGSWTAMGQVAMHSRVSAIGETASLAVRAPSMQLLPGRTYEFRMVVDGLGATRTFAPFKCQADVLIFDASRP